MADKNDDGVLKELYARQRMLEIQIRMQKKEIAKKEGKIFDSIDQLVCDKHPKAAFKIAGEIPGSIHYVTMKHLNIYVCELCSSDEHFKDLDFLDMMSGSNAHDCNECGIVKGSVAVMRYSSPREAWMSMAGREGNHYLCKVCGDQLGHRYWKFS
jgi:hypothetical protein